jgi:hypothetical protein
MSLPHVLSCVSLNLVLSIAVIWRCSTGTAQCASEFLVLVEITSRRGALLVWHHIETWCFAWLATHRDMLLRLAGITSRLGASLGWQHIETWCFAWLASHRDVVLRLAGNTSRLGASLGWHHIETWCFAWLATHRDMLLRRPLQVFTRTPTRTHTHTHTHTHTRCSRINYSFLFSCVTHGSKIIMLVQKVLSKTAAHCARYAPCGMATLPLKDLCQQHQLISHPWQWYYADSSDDHVYRRMQSRSRPALRLATTSHLHPATAYRMSPVARTRFNVWS